MDSMYKSLLEVIAVAEYSAEVGAALIALVLCYAAIDTISWLAASSDNQPVGERFQLWVDKYLLPESPNLKCTSEELYAARCGMVHTLSSQSDLHRRKGLRRLAYSWGSAEAILLQKRITEQGLAGKLVAVHLKDLTAGLRLGTARFFEEVEVNATLRNRIHEKSKLFYSSFGADTLKDESDGE
jgi:hypothetical protein